VGITFLFKEYKYRLRIRRSSLARPPSSFFLQVRIRVSVHFTFAWSLNHETEGAIAMVQSAAPQLPAELGLGRGSLTGRHWRWSTFRYSRRILVTAISDMILASILTGFLVFDLARKYPTCVCAGSIAYILLLHLMFWATGLAITLLRHYSSNT
jgi:hypothetical protein